MILPVLLRRFWFEAQDDLRFPDGKATNVLRGGFGMALRATASADHYQQIFEPRLEGPGPSGLADPPRPFLFRASHLDGLRVAKHDDLQFDVHVFGDARLAEPITSALVRLFEKGVGVGRGRARLKTATDLPLTLELNGATGEEVSRLRVRFLTPTELKHQGKVVVQPDFPILIRRVRDRVSTLLTLYGSGAAPEFDFQLFGKVADEVVTVRSDIDVRDIARTSSRTGNRHSIGGMVGEAEYAGPLERFVPFLRAAFYTGVGRHTVWGNGCLETTLLAWQHTYSCAGSR